MPDHFDIREIVEMIGTAGGQMAIAEEAFVDLGAIFDAIARDCQVGSLIGRLAKLGSNMCETKEIEYAEEKRAFNAHEERFQDAMRRLHVGVPHGK